MDLALCLGLSAVGGASVVVALWLRGRSPLGAARGSGPGPDPGSRQGTAARGLPADLEERLARFGRFTFDPGGGDTDADEVLRTLLHPLYPVAQADPARFLTTLRDRALPAGGWAVYGAAHLVWELLGGGVEHPAHHDLMTASLGFLRERGVPNSRLKGYEWEYWLNRRAAGEPWLVGRPKPTPQEAPVTPLRDGELRRVAQLWPEPDSNVLYVRRDPDGSHVLVVDARWSDDDPTRHRDDCARADTVEELYSQFGTNLQTPPFWCHPELEPYFPLPAPRLD
ncbi:hypothetical protein [Micromonospora carbonacea]|uniref:hypothetical protein n=1 Tax=Micromonospora carbonacea TaxID=47853 RepID=UPI003D7632EC